MNNERRLILQGKVCPYCGRRPELTNSSVIYGASYGLIWWCKPCDAYVGCHKGTNKALGRLANKELRTLKKAAHSFFDPMWKTKMKKRNMPQNAARNLAYEWLARQMGLPKDETHIGMFDEDQCRKVIELCKPYFKKAN